MSTFMRIFDTIITAQDEDMVSFITNLYLNHNSNTEIIKAFRQRYDE